MLSLLVLSFFMLIGCYLAGCIPLAFNFSSSKLRLVTIFGAGLLLGTALTVIIPEGIHSMYAVGNLKEHAHNNQKVMDFKTERKLLTVKDDGKLRKVNIDSVAEHMKVDNQGGKLLPVHGNSAKYPRGNVKGHSHVAHFPAESIHHKIGIVLVAGFIFMLIVDNISSIFSRHKNIVEIDSGEQRKRSRSLPATIGLVIHAAADGIALGAASSMSHFRLEMIVFMAIMLHKAPAAFGLVSFLLHDNMERPKIRQHLLVFSLAAPIMAIVTFVCLNEQAKEQLQEVNATGLALLFSAGTFLYVATVHVLPELSHYQVKPQVAPDLSASASERISNRNVVSSIDYTVTGFSVIELIIIIFGSCFPLVLSLGHSHE